VLAPARVVDVDADGAHREAVVSVIAISELRNHEDRTGDTPIDGALRPGYPGHMSAQAQAILEQALRLSADERAHLADALQRSLEDEASGLPPDEITRLWNDEIKRRLTRARDRVVRGEPLGRSADEVYADAEARIREVRARRER
jgi:hypothetical protein